MEIRAAKANERDEIIDLISAVFSKNTDRGTPASITRIPVTSCISRGSALSMEILSAMFAYQTDRFTLMGLS